MATQKQAAFPRGKQGDFDNFSRKRAPLLRRVYRPLVLYTFMTRSIIRICLSLIILCCPATSGAELRKLDICTDYHCDRIKPVTLDEKDWAQVRILFSAIETPEQERQKLRLAIALLEDKIGEATGTWQDLGKNVAGAGKPGQLDCISESKNTTSYLRLIQQDDLLRWHQVRERAVRHPWILDYHWTAVIEDLNSGTRYAVDSWYLDNGEPPYIQKLEDWRAKRRMTK